MTAREIQAFLADMYAVEVSRELIRTVTDGVVAEVTAWQSRPLEPMFRAFVPSCLRAFVPSCLRAFVPSCLRVFVSSCLRVFVSSCLRG
jgi:hypothetical protein